MNSQRLWKNAHDLHMSTADGVLELKGKVDAYPSLTQKLFPVDNHLKTKTFLHRGFPGETTLVMVDSVPNSRLLTQNKLNSIFGSSLCHNVKTGH